MRYKINDIADDGLQIDLPLPAAWMAEWVPEVAVRADARPLRLQAHLGPSGDDFLLRGTLTGALSMDCARCLEPVAVPIASDLAVVFVDGDAGKRRPPPKAAKAKDAEADEEDDEDGGLVVFHDGVIDLADELREEILLALPMSPRCEPECAGICPMCGANRDQEPCDCAEQRKIAGSPFAALAKLKS